MAYGLKYELLCTTLKGNLYKAKIYFDGYAGAQIDRDVPVRPFRLRKDKAAIIRGTSFEFSIRERVDFEFLEFYSNSLKKVKVEFCDGSNNLLWTGYNLTQQYQVPYTPAPTNVSFSATDGLGLLKNESFGLTGRKSQMEIICYCIDKIGLGLGYSIAIGLHEVNHNTARSPLEQTFENAEIFADLNCYEVIEKVLNKYNAEITQRKGKWAITRMADKKSTRLIYTAAGVYSATEAAPAVLNMGKKGDAGVSVWPRGALNLSIDPGARQVKFVHDYGRRSSLFSNVAFGWDVSASFTYEPRFNDKGAYAFIPGRNSTEQFIYKTIHVVNSPGQDFVFSVKSGALGYRLYGGLPIPVLMAVTFEAILTDGVNTRYLTESGWSATPSQITKKTSSTIGGEPRFNELTIITHELPFDGDLTVRLGRYHSMHEVNDSGWTIAGIVWADLNCYFVNEGQLYASGSEILATFINSTEPGSLPDIHLLSADAPDVANSDIYFKNITYLANGNITKTWPALPLYNMLALDLASDNRCAKQKLAGEIRGTGISFDSIIKHAYNSNREFEIAECTWEIYDEVYSVNLLELLPWSNEVVALTVVDNQNSSGTEPTEGAGSVHPPIIGDIYSNLADWFEVVNAESEDKYLMCKMPFGSVGDIKGGVGFDGWDTSIWDGLPTASETVKGGIKIGDGLAITDGVLRVDGSFASAWGDITGTLADQPDLIAALNAKASNARVDNIEAVMSTDTERIAALAELAVAYTTADTALNNTVTAALTLKAPKDNPIFTGIAQSPSFKLTGINDKFEVGTGDGASYTTYNSVITGWYGFGMYNPTSGGNYPYQCSGFYNFREGFWDTKSYPRINGTAINLIFAPLINPVFTGTAKVMKPGTTGNALVLEGGLINSGVDAWGCEIDINFLHDTTYNAGYIKLQGNLYQTWQTRFVLAPRIGDNTFIDQLFVDPDGVSAVGFMKGASLKTTNWTFEESGSDLLIKRGSTTLFKLYSTGKLESKDDQKGGVSL